MRPSAHPRNHPIGNHPNDHDRPALTRVVQVHANSGTQRHAPQRPHKPADASRRHPRRGTSIANTFTSHRHGSSGNESRSAHPNRTHPDTDPRHAITRAPRRTCKTLCRHASPIGNHTPTPTEHSIVNQRRISSPTSKIKTKPMPKRIDLRHISRRHLGSMFFFIQTYHSHAKNSHPALPASSLSLTQQWHRQHQQQHGRSSPTATSVSWRRTRTSRRSLKTS